ncbi:MAG: orotate phosphoribosyltransferase [Candidatus Omnitrophica bacterium]|nr:orotate phosphoribosyltransferase [Candidatus Omnitrophota bacterium]
MTEKEILDIFIDCGALIEGHFLLTSGLHSKKYFQKNLVLQYPRYTEKLCRQLSKKFASKKVDVVIAPAVGAIVLSYQLASIFKCRSIFTERLDGKMLLRRDFKIASGEKVLIAEDIVTTGGSVMELVELVRREGGEVIGICALVDRSKKKNKFEDVEFKSLLRLNLKTYKPPECPMCKKGLPLIKPGSR